MTLECFVKKKTPLQVREGQRWQDFGNNRPGPPEPAAQKPESPIAWSRAGGRFAKTARPQDAPRRSVLPGLQAAYFRFVIRSRLLYLELLFRSCEWFCDLLKSLWSVIESLLQGEHGIAVLIRSPAKPGSPEPLPRLPRLPSGEPGPSEGGVSRCAQDFTLCSGFGETVWTGLCRTTAMCR